MKQVVNIPRTGKTIRLDIRVPAAAPRRSEPHISDVDRLDEYLFCNNATATGNWHPVSTPVIDIIK